MTPVWTSCSTVVPSNKLTVSCELYIWPDLVIPIAVSSLLALYGISNCSPPTLLFQRYFTKCHRAMWCNSHACLMPTLRYFQLAWHVIVLDRDIPPCQLTDGRLTTHMWQRQPIVLPPGMSRVSGQACRCRVSFSYRICSCTPVGARRGRRREGCGRRDNEESRQSEHYSMISLASINFALSP